jgi:hypothetical protein
MNQFTPPRYSIDVSLLLALANKHFGKSVDCTMNGAPITDCDVLLHGACGPAVMRLMNLVAEEPGPIDKARLSELAPVAFAQAQDLDFGGYVIRDYGIVLQEPYGYGAVTLQLANLTIEHRPVLCRALQHAA